MPDPMDDIALQARQGSIAAIIQVLNEKLSSSGVRTRAVFSEGVLQLLCEAATAEQLEQSQLVARIKQILEAIAPRNLRRVNINSRLVREEQLLWLEEINRSPETQLLWSQEIILQKPNIVQQVQQHLTERKSSPSKKRELPKVNRSSKQAKRHFWQGIIGGVGFSILLFALGWTIYHHRRDRPVSEETSTNTTETVASPSSPTGTKTPSDPFVEAVRLAEQASIQGKTAQSSAQWLDLAAKWEKASDLMGKVSSDDPRYTTAQDRVVRYRQNSQLAQAQAKALRNN
ncbi:MAG: hypothetical protein SAJ37_09530 [Oscillatoria sp. PMC 1068.18]|nr:hypothetical protein [Oscillatoria sp. PMC 1076.18]MEC4988976.1 hypothetical protein [Oscillatoria sp. PMC 1068.18]